MALRVEVDGGYLELDDNATDQDIESAVADYYGESGYNTPDSPQESGSPELTPVGDGGPTLSDQTVPLFDQQGQQMAQPVVEQPAQPGQAITGAGMQAIQPVQQPAVPTPQQQVPRGFGGMQPVQPAEEPNIFQKFQNYKRQAIAGVADSFEGLDPGLMFRGIVQDLDTAAQDLNDELWQHIEERQRMKLRTGEITADEYADFWNTYAEDRRISSLAKEQKQSDLAKIKDELEKNRPEDLNYAQRALRSGTESVLTNLPSTTLSIMQANPLAMIYFGGVTANDAFNEARMEGASLPEAAQRGAAHGSLEVLTEYLPGKKLSQIAKGDTAKKLIEYFGAELVGENLNFLGTTAYDIYAGHGQLAEDWPKMSMEERVDFIAYGMGETSGATVVATGMQGGGAKTVGAIYNQWQKQKDKRMEKMAEEQSVMDSVLDAFDPNQRTTLEGQEKPVTMMEPAEVAEAQAEAAQPEMVEGTRDLPTIDEVEAQEVTAEVTPEAAPEVPAVPELEKTQSENPQMQKAIDKAWEVMDAKKNKIVDNVVRDTEATIRENIGEAEADAYRDEVNRIEADFMAKREQAPAPPVEEVAETLTPEQVEKSLKSPATQKSLMEIAEGEVDQALQAETDINQPVSPRDDLLTMVAKWGGMERTNASQEGFDPAGFKEKVKGKPIFPGEGGMTMDDLAERMVEEGFIPQADANQALELLDQAVRGEVIYTPEGQMAAQEAEASFLGRLGHKPKDVRNAIFKWRQGQKLSERQQGILNDVVAMLPQRGAAPVEVEAATAYEAEFGEAPTQEEVEAEAAQVPDDTRFKRDAAESGTVEFFKDIAAQPEEGAFQTPSSEKIDLGDIVQDVGQKLNVEAMEGAGRGGANVLRMKQTVSDELGDYEQDVLDLHHEGDKESGGKPFVRIYPGAGGKGASLYQMAFNWAKNNNKTIVPDPAGITKINRLRRNEAMISSALKLDTTEHMEPHEDQFIGFLSQKDFDRLQDEQPGVEGSQPIPDDIRKKLKNIKEKMWVSEKGVESQKERDRIFNKNLNNLMEATVRLVRKRAPQLKKMGFDTQGRLTYEGQVIENIDDFLVEQGLAEQASLSGVGNTTLRRAAIAQQLLAEDKLAGAAERGDVRADGTPAAASKPAVAKRRAARRKQSAEIKSQKSRKPGDTQRILYKRDKPVARKKGAPTRQELASEIRKLPFLGKNTKVVQSVENLPAAIRDEVAAQDARIPGVFHDGVAYVITDNVRSLDEGVTAAIHETVGHKGVRGVLGQEATKIFKQVYNAKDKDLVKLRKEIEQDYGPLLEGKSDNFIANLVGEEMIAHYAQDQEQKQPNIITWAIARIKELLRQKFNINMSTKDLDLLLQRSRDYLEAQRPTSITDVELDPRYMVVEKPKVEELQKEIQDLPGVKTVSLFVNSNGDLKLSTIIVDKSKRKQGVGSDAVNRIIKFADENGLRVVLSPAVKDDFQGTTSRARLIKFYKRFGFKENKGRNKDFSISEGMYRDPVGTEVSQARFSRVEDKSNIDPLSLQDETFLQKVLRTYQDRFNRLKVVQQQIEETGRDISEEADAYIAEELFHGKVSEDLNILERRYIEPLFDKMAETGVTQDELDMYLWAKHAPERNEYIATINEEMPDGGSGMPTAEANKVVARMEAGENGKALKELAQMVYDMTQLRLKVMKKYGLEDPDVIDEYQTKYKNYVPLKGLAFDENQNTPPRIGRGFSIKGKEDKAALGRVSPPDSAVKYVIHDMIQTLIRNRKNEAGNAFLNLVQEHPAPEYWEVFSAENPDVTRSMVAGKVEERNMTAPEMRRSEEYFVTKKDGKEYYIKIKDPLLMRAMKNLGVDNQTMLTNMMGRVTRFLSQTLTSWNPEFVISNFARDIQTAVYNVLAEQTGEKGKIKGKQIAKDVVKDTPKAVWAILGAEIKDKQDSEFQKYYNEFKKSGAKTGWFHVETVEQLGKTLENFAKRAQPGVKGATKRTAHAALKFIENVNTAIENGVRLSTYIHARKAGLSEQQAATLAKNLTVNFNRKGEAGVGMNAAFMFFNASVQGSAQFLRTMFMPARTESGRRKLNTAQKAAIGMATFAFMLAEINRLISDDDEDGDSWYDEIPDYVKERNMIIMDWRPGHREKGEYWKIPLPYGYNIFHVTGTTANEMMHGKRSAPEGAGMWLKTFFGSFSPLGISESEESAKAWAKTLSPTIVRPLTELAVNENHFGSPIYKTNFPGQVPLPDSALAQKNTGEFWKSISEFINEATGGNQHVSGGIDISPDTLEHLYEFGTGGIGRFVNRSYEVTEAAISGEDIETRKIPFVRSVRGEPSRYEDQGQYYSRKTTVQQHVKAYESIEEKAEREAYAEEYKDQLFLGKMATDVDKKLRKLNKQLRKAEAAENQEQIDAINARKDQLYDVFNKEYNKRLRDK